MMKYSVGSTVRLRWRDITADRDAWDASECDKPEDIEVFEVFDIFVPIFQRPEHE